MALTISQHPCLPCCPPLPVSGAVSHVALVHVCRWITSGQAWFTCETCLSTPVVMESHRMPRTVVRPHVLLDTTAKEEPHCLDRLSRGRLWGFVLFIVTYVCAFLGH